MKRPPLRNCDECVFSEEDGKTCRCAHGHKPVFVVPSGYSEIMSGEWGWMLRCADFKTTKPAPRTLGDMEKQDLAIERYKWRMKGEQAIP